MNQLPRILLFTGDGKGKTTAALGMLLRAVGHNMAACLVQFLKAAPSGELAALERLGVTILRAGRGFVPARDSPALAGHRQAAEEALRLAAEAIACERFGLVVLDEVCTAVSCGLISEEQVLELLRAVPGGGVVALTGRGATEGLLAVADTVTQMQCVRHGYEKGIAAQKGVEL